MSHWLLRAPEMPGGPWQWLAPGAADIAAGDLQQLAAARAAVPTASARLLLPTASVLTVPVTVPLRQHRQMQSAFPFLVEENLAGDVDQCHVVAGTRIDLQRLQLAAIDRHLLTAVLADLRAAGFDPVLATSEALALRLPARGATLLLDGEHSLLATTGGQTLAFDQADAATVASMLGMGEGDVVQVLLGPRGDPLAARAIESELLTRESAPQVAIDEVPMARLLLLADALRWHTPVNLRQGTFAATGESALAMGFNWRPLATLAAVWMVLALGYQLAVGFSHDRAAARVQDAQVALYRQLFPAAKNVTRPRAQMEGQLKGSGGGASFAALVGQTAETIAQLGGKDSGRYTPRTIGWDATQGELHVDILARGLEDIEPLRNALQKRGLAVEVGSGVSQGGGYKARLNITLPAMLAGGAP